MSDWFELENAGEVPLHEAANAPIIFDASFA